MEKVIVNFEEQKYLPSEREEYAFLFPKRILKNETFEKNISLPEKFKKCQKLQ
jgi:hypothetical protein